MKTFLSILFFISLSLAGLSQVGINTDGSQPNSSAMLDVKSVSKGVLIPRMIGQQMQGIVQPATGLLVYNISDNNIYYYNGSSWVSLGLGGLSWLLGGNSGTNAGTNFLGTTDNVPLIFRVNNQTAGQVDPVKYNISMGYKALFSNTTGLSNVALGTFALNQNTTSSNLVAIGDSALYNNVDG